MAKVPGSGSDVGSGFGAEPGSSAGGEDAFVARYLAPLSVGDPGALGLKDDCALVEPQDGGALVMTCDTLVEDSHFLFDGSPELAGAAAHKALGVNVSDLAAKGARARAYLMSLVLPQGDFEIWMPAFVGALAECQQRWGVTLIGGDTVRSADKLAITITAIGEVPAGKMVLRSNAKPGDGIFVSGAIGDAALGLRVCRRDGTSGWLDVAGEAGVGALIDRYQRPEPRGELAWVVREFARAAIDVSDGLVRDLSRLCVASGCGAEIFVEQVPLSDGARALVENGEVGYEELVTGGDDYEIIACVSARAEAEFLNAAAASGVRVTRIGSVSPDVGVRIAGRDGAPMVVSTTGWDHLE